MNPFRPIFALLGLASIVLFYIYRNSDFLVLALIFFAIGLAFMGVFKRPKKSPSNNNENAKQEKQPPKNRDNKKKKKR